MGDNEKNSVANKIIVHPERYPSSSNVNAAQTE